MSADDKEAETMPGKCKHDWVVWGGDSVMAFIDDEPYHVTHLCSKCGRRLIEGA